MAHYVVLGNFTEQGIRAVKDTGKRAGALRDTARQMGVTIKDIFWTLGRYDVVITAEAAGDEAVAALTMKVGALGNLKCQTLRAFSEMEINSLTSRI